MAMNQTVLEDELKAMLLYDTETATVSAWADMFANYFQGDGASQGAQSNGFYVVSAAIPAAKTAMAGGLLGMSEPGQAASKIASGITLFWAALIPATAWPTVTLITPPPLITGLTAALQAAFNVNISDTTTKDAAMAAIAAVVHSSNQGGSAIWPGPTVFPIV